ncbi:hypothetical protein KIL84_010332 [Mauremys mutica]|uniref:Uncharacterized protein n=1 Tax=Mauremys mutica TaxID=74926 RepID=A0A9D3XCQ0_9SAUR|nr:hypothetical protein KIL84_010332 [Mauremys mutica]
MLSLICKFIHNRKAEVCNTVLYSIFHIKDTSEELNNSVRQRLRDIALNIPFKVCNGQQHNPFQARESPDFRIPCCDEDKELECIFSETAPSWLCTAPSFQVSPSW